MSLSGESGLRVRIRSLIVASNDRSRLSEDQPAQFALRDETAQHESRRRAFADRYFALWPDEREAVLAAHHREGREVGRILGTDMYSVALELDEIIAASADGATITRFPVPLQEPYRRLDETWRRAWSWVVTAMATYSGSLAASLSGYLIPIFTDEEMASGQIRTADLRAAVPVAIEVKGPPWTEPGTSTRDLIASASAAQLGFEPVAPDEMPKALRARFVAMQTAYAAFAETPAAAQMLPAPAATRATYRDFADAFFTWYNKGPATQRRQRQSPGALFGSSKTMPLLAAPPMQVALESMIVDDKERAWRNLHTPHPPLHGDPAGTHVTIGDPRSAQLSREQQLASAETVLKLSDEHAQTFVYLMARWIVDNEGLAVPQAARVHVNELLDFRELVRKKRDFKAEQKREEGTRILHLNAIWVRVLEKVAPRGKTRRTKLVNVYSRLIELSIETEADSAGAPIPMMFDGVPPESVPYAFRFRPGSWIESYWGNAAHAGLIFKKVLGYDTRERAGRMAMRITLFLSFVPFRQDIMKVEDLLRAAHITVPETQPARSREAFDDALGRLRDDGIIESYEYIDGDPPDSGKGWRGVWLASRIRIHVATDRTPVGLTAPQLPPLA